LTGLFDLGAKADSNEPNNGDETTVKQTKRKANIYIDF
jgi:hypothetical protein